MNTEQELDDIRARLLNAEASIQNLAYALNHGVDFPNVAVAPVPLPVAPTDVPPHPAPATPPKPEWIDGRCDYGHGVTARTFEPLTGKTFWVWVGLNQDHEYSGPICESAEAAHAACDAFIAAVRGEVATGAGADEERDHVDRN